MFDKDLNAKLSVVLHNDPATQNWLTDEAKAYYNSRPDRIPLKLGTFILAQNTINSLLPRDRPFVHVNGSNIWLVSCLQAKVDREDWHIKEPINRDTIECDGVTAANAKVARIIEESMDRQADAQTLVPDKGRLKFSLFQCPFDMNVSGSNFNKIINMHDIANTAQLVDLTPFGGNYTHVVSPAMQVFIKLQVMDHRDNRYKDMFCAKDVAIMWIGRGGTIAKFIDKYENEITAGLKKGYLDEFGVRTVEQFQETLVKVAGRLVSYGKHLAEHITRNGFESALSKAKPAFEISKREELKRQILCSRLDLPLLRHMREEPLLSSEQKDEIKKQIRDRLPEVRTQLVKIKSM